MNGNRQRHFRGQMADAAGRSAESQVRKQYEDSGADFLAERWRGAGGEIDLIFRKDNVVIFAEVKKSKSHASASAALGARQQARIFAAAEEFAGTLPTGSLTEMRFDVALVDQHGVISVIEGALAA